MRWISIIKIPKGVKWPRFTADVRISISDIGFGFEIFTLTGITANIRIGPIRFSLQYWPKKVLKRWIEIEESNRVLEAYTPQEIKDVLDFLSQS